MKKRAKVKMAPYQTDGSCQSFSRC